MNQELGSPHGTNLRPAGVPYAIRLLLALALGAVGGYLFAAARLPLPWMLGSLTACTIAALLRLPVAVPRRLRIPMTAIIGVMLGSRFTLDVFAGVSSWLPTIAWLILFVLICGAICTGYFRMVAGFDHSTAFFCAMPGGFMEMVTMAEHHGARVQTVALTHSARIMLLVLVLPFAVQWIGGVSATGGPRIGTSMLSVPMSTHLWFAATAGAGLIAGQALRLPAAAMMGPFLASMAIHASGLSDFEPSYEIVNFAQLVLGAYLGSSFGGAARGDVARVLFLSSGATLLLGLTTLAFAALASLTSDYGLVPLLLAYSPGGLAEMSLISLALQVETAFVTCHHFIRILLVVLGVPPAYRLYQRFRP